MNKKFFPILIISLLILPAVFALASPMDILRDIFGSNGYLVQWFGGDVVASGSALLAYLRIALFITLLTIIFEILVNLSVFQNRRNSAIVIAVTISGLASFFVSTELYQLLLLTYNLVIWFVILGVPIAIVFFLNFFIIPNTNRYWIALRIILLLLLFYLLTLIGEYSSGLFTIGNRSTGVRNVLLPSIFLPYKPKTFKFKTIFLSITAIFLIIIPSAIAAQELGIISTFAEWLRFLIIIFIIYEFFFHFIPGGTEEKEKRKKETERIRQTSRPTSRKSVAEWAKDVKKNFVELGKTISTIDKTAEDEKKVLEREKALISEELKKEIEDLKDIKDLFGLIPRLDNPHLSDEDKGIILQKVESIIQSTPPPIANLKSLEKIEELINQMITKGEELKKYEQHFKELSELAEKGKLEAGDINKLQMFQRAGLMFHSFLNKIIKDHSEDFGINEANFKNSRFNKLQQQFNEAKTALIESIKGGRYKNALSHAESFYEAKLHAKALLEEALSQEESIKHQLKQFDEQIGIIESLLDRLTK